MYLYPAIINELNDSSYEDISRKVLIIAPTLEKARVMLTEKYPLDKYSHGDFPMYEEIDWGMEYRNLAWEVLDSQREEIIEL